MQSIDLSHAETVQLVERLNGMIGLSVNARNFCIKCIVYRVYGVDGPQEMERN